MMRRAAWAVIDRLPQWTERLVPARLYYWAEPPEVAEAQERLARLAMFTMSGIVVADILLHPEGTKAAADAVAALLRPVAELVTEDPEP